MIQGLVRPALAVAFLGGIALTAFAPAPASARVVVGFGFGFPFLPPPIVYAPPPAYYYPPPMVYAPPPPAYAPPPVSYTPPATAASAAQAGQTCREYQTTAVIDGKPQQTYGTACLQPDGTWRIVR